MRYDFPTIVEQAQYLLWACTSTSMKYSSMTLTTCILKRVNKRARQSVTYRTQTINLAYANLYLHYSVHSLHIQALNAGSDWATDLNVSRIGAVTTVVGKVFQVGIILGKNESWSRLHLYKAKNLLAFSIIMHTVSL